MRWCSIMAALVVSAGCSGGSGPDVASVGPATSTATSSVPSQEQQAETTQVQGDVPGATATVPSPVAQTVGVTVRTATVDAALEGRLATSIDPFGEFASCSGLRAWVGTYSVLISTGSGAVRSISLVTDDPVDGPGIYDAAVRLEPATGPAIDALGTLTLDGGLTAGSYLAFDVDGEQVEGDFECVGAGSPEPLAVGASDAELEVVEVFALLRSGDDERLVGLAVAAGAGASVECPGVAGTSGSTLVRVDGDASIGAISTFELTGGPMPTMRMRIGGTVYEFAAVTLGDADSPASGSFSAEADGVTVDGAFRCS